MEDKKMERQKLNDQERNANTLAILVSEILFTILPLIVLAIVLAYSGRSYNIMFHPEWSFVATILFGQTLIKTIAATITKASVEHVHWQRVVFIASALIVIGIVPSLIVLALILVADAPSIGLAITQFALCITSVVTFLVFGGAMQDAVFEHENK